MATANNNKEFSGLLTPAGGALNEIADSTDNVHTGIVKALSKLASGNIPVKGFNITGSSSSSLTFATGDTLVDGVKQTVGSGLTVTIDTTNTSRYTLIVANGTSLVARTHSTDNAIPAANEDDVIIGVAKNTGSDPPLFQYLTVSKDSNTVSIARDNSGYTESATIKSNSGDIEFEALEQDKDIIFKVNDGGASTEVMRIDGDVSRVGIGTNSPATTLDVKGDTSISRSATSGETRTLSIEGARNATGSDYARLDFKNYDSDGPTSYTGARISASNEADGVNDGSLVFSTNNANAGMTEQMRIDDEGNVGIGTNSPETALHVEGSGHIIRIKDTSAGDTALTRTMGGVELSAAGMNTTSKFGVPIKFMSTDSAFTTENPKFLAAIVPIARESYTADTKGGMAIGFATTANSAGASTVPQVNMTLDHNGRLGIGTGGPTVELDVSGQARISSHVEINGDLDHDGSNVGFFGTAVAAQQSVGNLASNTIGAFPLDPTASQQFSSIQQAYLAALETEINGLRTKVDALIDALQLYGLIT